MNEESLEIYRNNKVVANKQNPQRIGTEQPADLTQIFPIMQRLQQVITVTDIPVDRHSMKRVISNAFYNEKTKGTLNLKPNKSKSLIDFVSSIPEMTAKAVTRENVSHGFLAAGYIDKQFFRYPDLDKIFAISQRRIT